jgi:hypothetical protein
MYSNLGKGIALLLFFGFCRPYNLASAEEFESKTANTPIADALEKMAEADLTSLTEIDFVAQPDQCVTLRQGRDCFATIKLKWQASAKENICLYQNDQQGKSQQLMCWKNNNAAQINIEFQSNESINYQLRTSKNNHVIAETQVKVSWQYKTTSRKRRWRLF